MRSVVCAISTVFVVTTGLTAGSGPAMAVSPCFPDIATLSRTTAAGIDKAVAPVERQLLHDVGSKTPAAGAPQVKTGHFDGVVSQLTKTRNGDGSVTELFALAAPAGGFVDVWSATATRSATGAVTKKSVSLSYDFDALHARAPISPRRGVVNVDGNYLYDPTEPGPKIDRHVSFVNFLPEEGDPHGPRTGSYTHLGEPGVGGLFDFQDSVALGCPLPSDPALPSDTRTVDRWYKAPDGKIHGRSDTKASGGTIPVGEVFLGASCWRNSETKPKIVAEIDKLEDANGVTLDSQVLPNPFPPDPCDPAFGTLPAATNNATDYDFASPVTFPGES